MSEFELGKGHEFEQNDEMDFISEVPVNDVIHSEWRKWPGGSESIIVTTIEPDGYFLDWYIPVLARPMPLILPPTSEKPSDNT